MSKVLLVLGCGNVPLGPPKYAEGTWTVVNHDRTLHAKHVTEAWDLNQLPWPWATNSITLVVAYSVLEHLKIDLFTSINECHRILKPNGTLRLKVPLWDKEEAWDDPTHRWLAGRHILDIFDPTTDRSKRYGYFYGASRWRIVTQTTIPGGASLYGQMEALK